MIQEKKEKFYELVLAWFWVRLDCKKILKTDFRSFKIEERVGSIIFMEKKD